MAQSAGKNSSAKPLGCLILIGIAVGLAWVAWDSAFGCFLADQFDYVTCQCALSHLQKPACNEERDILGVDEVTDSSHTEKTGRRFEVRTVIYRFRKRPKDSPVSDEVLRDTATLFKLQNGQWIASCENVSNGTTVPPN